MRVLISGGTGMVGSALTDAFRSDGTAVNHLVRRKEKSSPGDVTWNPTSAMVDVPAMEGYDAVVHLSGASVAHGRWTKSRKLILRNSRVDTTRVLVDALARLKQKPSVFLCASATGYYGSRGDELLTETSGNGSDLLGLLCRAWEAEASRASTDGIRTVITRFGIILSPTGGALSAMAAPFRLGLGGRLGSGRQWMSWIALQDVLAVVRAAIAEKSWSGPFNVVAPEPVRNADFTHILASVLHRPAFFAVPPFALRIALGDMADALLLASQRVQPTKLQAAGYRFRQENLGCGGVFAANLALWRRISVRDDGKKNGSREVGEPFLPSDPAKNFYCVERSICVMLMVLMLRSMGVCGGSKLGVRNCVSKVY